MVKWYVYRCRRCGEAWESAEEIKKCPSCGEEVEKIGEYEED